MVPSPGRGQVVPSHRSLFACSFLPFADEELASITLAVAIMR